MVVNRFIFLDFCNSVYTIYAVPPSGPRPPPYVSRRRAHITRHMPPRIGERKRMRVKYLRYIIPNRINDLQEYWILIKNQYIIVKTLENLCIFSIR